MAEKPTTPEPKRHWYQFRLRTLLIGVASRFQDNLLGGTAGAIRLDPSSQGGEHG